MPVGPVAPMIATFVMMGTRGDNNHGTIELQNELNVCQISLRGTSQKEEIIYDQGRSND